MITTHLPSFKHLNDTDKFVFLLSNCDIIIFSAKTCSKMLNIQTDVSRTDFMGYFCFNIVFSSLLISYGLSFSFQAGILQRTYESW